MSTGEIAGVIGAIAGAILVVGVLYALFTLSRAMQTLQHAVDDLHGEALPLLEDVKHIVKQANADLDRAGRVLERAESLTRTLDAASRLAYLTFSNPVVKAVAFGSGVARASRRFRRGER